MSLAYHELPAAQQPQLVEFHCADGIYIRQAEVPAGAVVPQHSHAWAHSTCVAVGEFMAWKEGHYLGRFKAPAVIFIEAGVKHTFLALERTVFYCMHNLHGEDAVRVLEEHELTPGEVEQLLREVVT